MEKNTLGEIIHHLRKKAGLTQEALADGICSPVSISRIENGKQMPSGKVLEQLLARLAQALISSAIFIMKTSVSHPYAKL